MLMASRTTIAAIWFVLFANYVASACLPAQECKSIIHTHNMIDVTLYHFHHYQYFFFDFLKMG